MADRTIDSACSRRAFSVSLADPIHVRNFVSQSLSESDIATNCHAISLRPLQRRVPSQGRASSLAQRPSGHRIALRSVGLSCGSEGKR